jgi:hypothetical protein
MAVDKPDTTRVWASAAPPTDIEDPDISSPGKVEDGYRDEIPVYQHHNWIFNEASKSAKYLNEQGIGIWDAITTFPVGSIVKGSDLNLYQAIVEQSNNDPVGDKVNWRPFVTSTTAGGRKNLLDNGEFRIWQEGTSFVADANAEYTADRFVAYCIGSTAQIDRASNSQFPTYQGQIQYGLRFRPSAGATEGGVIQRIEHSNTYHLQNKSITLSFILNSNENTVIGVDLTTPDVTDDWSSFTSIDRQLSIPVSIGDNKIEVTFNSLDSSVVRGLSVTIGFTTFTAGSFDASIALTQLEVGTVATDFEYVNIFEDSARCQRYFYSSYDPGVTPGTPYANRSPLFYPQSASTDLFGTHTFSQGMRVRPSITIFRPSTGTIGEVERENETFPLQVASLEFSVFGLFGIILTSAPAVDIFYQFHLTADARL